MVFLSFKGTKVQRDKGSKGQGFFLGIQSSKHQSENFIRIENSLEG